MDVRAAVRRALSRPSPRVQLALFSIAAATAVAVTAAVDPSPPLLAGTFAVGGGLALAAGTELKRARERHQVLEVLEAAERARLLREFVAAREGERQVLWERLHDQVLQTTAGNLLRLDAARVLLEDGRDAEARALMTEAARTERRVFDDLRRLMAEMNVDPLRMPGADPLHVLVSVPEREPAYPVGESPGRPKALA
jgi:signal transduction histidine kinase